MPKRAVPYIGPCHFCGQGLLRFMQCPTCERIMAYCDECELIWKDIPAVYANSQVRSSGSYPKCPGCKGDLSNWKRPTLRQLRAAKLDRCIRGRSP